VSFPVTSGQNYIVTVSDYGSTYFNHYSNGFTVRSIPVTANSSTTALTAIYTTTPQTPPSTDYSITVNSHDLNGTALNGFYVDLRVNGNHIEGAFTSGTLSNLQPGVQYQVVIYWFGNYYFRDFSNGDLNRYELVTLNTTAGQNTVTLNALYQYVPPAKAATLNILAQLTNGTQIGTTFNNTGYIQHTPGMWLTVTPPGTTTPFTGTFTGGSILPFVLINDQTYTVQMTPSYNGYTFAYWKDSGSTNPVRAIALNGNASYTAVYTYAAPV
jgi:hypothetical protein